MTEKTPMELVLGVLRDLMEAEAAYRSAMHIYKDHPRHQTRIKAECNWTWAKSNARCILSKYDPNYPPAATADAG
jgi:hypothetical protein